MDHLKDIKANPYFDMSSHGFLSFCAALALETEPKMIAWALHYRRLLELPTNRLHEVIGRYVQRCLNAHMCREELLEKPFDREIWMKWLEEIEFINLACHGLRSLPSANFPWALGLADALSPLVNDCVELLKSSSRCHLFAGLAARRLSEYPVLEPPVAPWAFVTPVPFPQTITTLSDVKPRDIFDAWQDELLHEQDEATLMAAVRERGGWGDLYRKHVYTSLRHPISIVCSDFAFLITPLLFNLPLPHLGRQKFLRGERTPEGTRWIWPDDSVPVDVPLNTPSVSLSGDAIISNFTISFEYCPVSLMHNAYEGFCAMCRLLEKKDASDEAYRVSRQALSLLLQEEYLGQMHKAAQLAVNGQVISSAEREEFYPWIMNALRLRLMMHRYLTFLPELRADIDRLDQRYSDVAGAVLLLPEDIYERILESVLHILDANLWWGIRKRTRLTSNPDLDGLFPHPPSFTPRPRS